MTWHTWYVSYVSRGFVLHCYTRSSYILLQIGRPTHILFLHAFFLYIVQVCVCVWRGENLCLCFPLHKHVGWFWRTVSSDHLLFSLIFSPVLQAGSHRRVISNGPMDVRDRPFPHSTRSGPRADRYQWKLYVISPYKWPNIKGGNLGKPYRGPITSLLTGCGTHLCNQMVPPGSQRCTSSWESWLAGRMDGMMGKVALHSFCGKWCQ